MPEEVEVPIEVLDQYKTSQRILTSIDSDIIHLQSDLKGYLEINKQILMNLINRIKSLEKDKSSK